jgi:hypothetical protein
MSETWRDTLDEWLFSVAFVLASVLLTTRELARFEGWLSQHRRARQRQPWRQQARCHIDRVCNAQEADQQRSEDLYRLWQSLQRPHPSRGEE